MFRYTLTLIAIFLVLHQPNLAAARSIEPVKQDKKSVQKREVAETEKSLEAHSRSKRSWGGAWRAASALGFATSIGVTIWSEIDKCQSVKPSDACKKPTCDYHDCPSVCKDVADNNAYLQSEKEVVNNLLDEMDQTQLDVFNLALDAASASISNEIILKEIDEINDKVDRVMFSMVRMDQNVSKEFAARSTEIAALLRDYRFDLDDIVGSQAVDGIFDKWTWDGTGIFALQIAVPGLFKGRQIIKRRFAINKIYKELKVDFLARVDASVSGSPKARAFQKDAWVKSLQQPKVQAQLKTTAKTIYQSQQAQKQPGKWATRMENSMNIAVTALSIYFTWKLIDQCHGLANDLQDSAFDMAEQRDAIEKVKQTELEPLWVEVQEQAWGAVKELLTNDNMTIWLGEIRNLTLNAATVNTTTANTIQYFVDNIDAAGVDKTMSMQTNLIEALKSIDFKYDCLGDKLHAISIVLDDCASGKDAFETLYKDVAVVKNELNRDDCVNRNEVPYTSIDEFRTIVEAWAGHQGWYSNCLLNSGDLLYQVCTEYLKGYKDPDVLVAQVNKTDLTSEMVENFLTRCPDPEITPKSIETTCSLYCKYDTVPSIAEIAILKESQVESIIETCPICGVDEDEALDICNQYYCKSVNVTNIEEDVELPLPTVEYVIANNCSLKCTIYDTEDKNKICDKSKCKAIDADEIAEDLRYPVSAVDEVILDCDTILPSCGEIDQDDIDSITFLYCTYGSTAAQINMFAVDLPVDVIQGVIDGLTCR